MIEKIMKVLSNINTIDEWKIIEQKTESSELFYVKKQLDMNRCKDVHMFKITVYKNFEEDNKKYKGSSTTNIYPNMTIEEIEQILKDTAFAASFVKNEYYPLVKSTTTSKIEEDSVDFSKLVSQLTDSIYAEDVFEKGGINSSELFLNKIFTRIVNSEGADVSFNKNTGELEAITNWTEDGEEVELYKHFKFADFHNHNLRDEVKEMLNISREKAIAKSTPALKKYTVLLTGEPAVELLKYYYIQANAQFVYEGISTAKVNENIQGEDVIGDNLNMTLNPFMEGSTESAPYDNDGLALDTVELYKDGVLQNYMGSTRYSSYLGVEPTGEIKNICVKCGNKTIEELKSGPYLELVAFSDFQMNPLTGDFGGEIRLGWYYDGNKRIPVTGGSISGNIKEVQKEIYFSKESQRNNSFVGPKSIKLLNVSISGS